MSATNTTEFLGLGQYVATDKPSFLGTYNSDMRSIDNFAKDISVRMGVVEEESGTAETDISNIQDEIETITANVNNLIDKTGNIEQDETQIALNTSDINNLKQTTANINGSVTELIEDVENLDNSVEEINSDIQDIQETIAGLVGSDMIIHYGIVNTATNNNKIDISEMDTEEPIYLMLFDVNFSGIANYPGMLVKAFGENIRGGVFEIPVEQYGEVKSGELPYYKGKYNFTATYSISQAAYLVSAVNNSYAAVNEVSYNVNISDGTFDGATSAVTVSDIYFRYFVFQKKTTA